MTEEILGKRKKGSRKPKVVANDEGKTPLHIASEGVIDVERGELSAARRRREARGEEMREADCGKRSFTSAERKRAAKEGAALQDGSFPIYDADDLSNAVHLAGHAKDPDAARAHIRARARALKLPDPYSDDASKAAGNPVPQGAEYMARRDGRVNSRELAYAHPDMRQQGDLSFDDVLANLRTVAPGDHPDADIVYVPGAVALASFDARARAGRYTNMQPVNHSPARPDYHQGRQSAAPANGSHSAANGVVSTAVPGKNRSNLDIMKAHIREQIHRG